MSYQTFDFGGDPVTPAELENRGVWMKYGNDKEEAFLQQYGQQLGIMKNPAKVRDPAVPDFLYNNDLADLKTQNTPIFIAKVYDVDDPTYAVTFNLKDAFRYGPWGMQYPNLHIFFWVDWQANRIRFRNNAEILVNRLTGVWYIPYSEIEKHRSHLKIHWYKERPSLQHLVKTHQNLLDFEPRLACDNQQVRSLTTDDGNATCSYVLDLREMKQM